MLGVTYTIALRQVARTADAMVDRVLVQSVGQIHTQLDAQQRALIRSAEMFAADPKFFGLLQHKENLADLLDQSIEAAERTGVSWTQVTDEAGIRLTKSDEPGAESVDLSGSALVRGALGGSATAGYGRDQAQLLQIIAVPIRSQAGSAATVHGSLMAARTIDNAFADAIKQASPDSVDVVFFVRDSTGPRVTASTLGDAADADAAVRDIPWPTSPDSAAVASIMRSRSTLAGVQYELMGAQLRTAAGSPVGGLVVFKDHRSEFATFRSLERTILLWGAVGIVLSGLLALGLARQITRPVLALVGATRRAAAGDYSADITLTAGGELGTLADAFRRMLKDLRTKQELVEFLSLGHSGARTGAAAAAPTLAMTTDAGGLRAGMTLASRYEVKELLGVGGMGMVFKAWDTELGETIAIKTLRQDMVDTDARALDRFKGEIRFARKISHRNVVRTHDIGESDGVYFITMEFVEGKSLKDLIVSRGRLPIAIVLAVAKQLSRALEVAHGEGVIHRDIKPANMIVQPDGVLKVMDFGIARLAKRMSGATQVGMVVGTPEYMAPEQLMGSEIDVRADIYAVGCVLYECVTGKTPITADTPMALVARVFEGMLVDPRALNGEVSEELSAIILSCLAKNPDGRPPNAAALYGQLDAIG